jgi:Fe-S-cluster-containing dehydrogenase component
MKEHRCTICSKDLTGTDYRKLYCSISCKNKVRTKIKKAQRNAIVALRPKKKCPMCENFILNGQIKACSKACATKLRHNKDYRQAINKYAILRGHKIKEKLVSLSGDCCQSCGYNKNYAALQFHHIDPKTKSFALNGTSSRIFSWEEVVKEMAKCLLLCANCHMELHHPKLHLMSLPNIIKI